MSDSDENVLLCVDGTKINDLQRASIDRVLAAVRGAHYVNIYVRKNGQDHHYEADWLWHTRRANESEDDSDA